jgi:hypothetical protein
MKSGLLAFAIICTCIHQQAFATLQAYEGFDYPNTGSNLLSGMNGGTGWASAWRFFGTTVPTTADNGHRLSQDDASIQSAAFPFTPIGDRVISKGIGAGNNTWADRTFADPFSFSTDGDVRYFSFLFQKDTGLTDTANDNMEVDFWSGSESAPATQTRFGSTSGEQFFFNNTSSPTFENLTVGQPYFVVLKLESHNLSNDVLSAITYGPTETVPTTEPAVWDSVRTPGLSATINGIRLWIGVPTTGEYDEIRMGTTWADVAAAPTFPAGDFNKNGVVDAADYVLWRKNAAGQFVPGDYEVWRQNFGATAGAGAALQGGAVPEPATGAILLTGILLFTSSRRAITGRRLT